MAYKAGNEYVEFLQVTLLGAAPSVSYPPAKLRIGTLLFDETAGVLWQVTLSGTTRVWTAVGGSAASVVPSHDYYVATTGSDSAAGTSIAPLLTVDEAIRRISIAPWTTTAHITLQDNITLPSGAYLRFPRASIAGAEQVMMLSAFADAGDGVVTIGGGTLGDVSTTAMAPGTVTGLGLAAGRRGARIRWLTGNNAGTEQWSVANATVSLTAHTKFPFLPVAGDTLRLETPSGGLIITSYAIIEGPVTIYGPQISGGGLSVTLVLNGDVGMGATTVRIGSNGAIKVSEKLTTDLSETLIHPSYTLEELGVYMDGGRIDVSNGAVFSGGNSYFRGVPMDFAYGSTFTVQESYLDSTSYARGDSASGQIARSFYVNVTPATASTAVLFFDNNSGVTVDAVSVADTLNTGSALMLEGSSWAEMGLFVGTANQGYGVHARHGSSARALFPNSSTIVTGTLGNVKVGANAATTWALIAGGLTANVSDQGAASTERVWVGP